MNKGEIEKGRKGRKKVKWKIMKNNNEGSEKEIKITNIELGKDRERIKDRNEGKEKKQRKEGRKEKLKLGEN